MITFQSENIAFPKIKRSDTKNWIKSVVLTYGKKVGDVNYIFCDDEKILEVNNQYLAHDYYTDIITFDYSENDVISGDIFISLDTVRSNSEKFGTEYGEELYRVIIHGVLHLCGIADKSEKEAKKMREAENNALKLLIIF
ncbi:MAG: rRNA maturation RNase YbeY [Dysgonamonadaceae bacterium]|jgi:rRNA maturation RNase YbeY|nr:rRNA maturation RNase YbeY [Dysgonamonadaceae bacterium]